MMAVALELQHGVDDMLEYPGAGKAAFLGDMADEHDRHIALFRFVHQPMSAAAHLPDTAWQ